jgi:hypothetical protein
MGVLDDAIREHLELKRKHGASEQEIERQEAEALGPARRIPVEPEAGAGLDAAAPADAQPLEEELPPPEPLPAESEPLAAGDEAIPAETQPVSPAETPAAEELSGRDAAAIDAEPPAEPVPPEPAAGEGDQPPAAAPEEPVLDESAPVGEAPVEDVPVEEAPVEDDPLALPAEPEPPSAVDDGAADEPRDTASDGDDLLEETPDFLQDTPDHDRLWFEQKPPRDFDLD